MNRSIFIIREKDSGLYCSSSKHKEFGAYENAALFLQRQNADKAVKEMYNGFIKGYSMQYIIHNGLGYTYNNITNDTVFEVVECTLSIAASI